MLYLKQLSTTSHKHALTHSRIIVVGKPKIFTLDVQRGFVRIAYFEFIFFFCPHDIGQLLDYSGGKQSNILGGLIETNITQFFFLNSLPRAGFDVVYSDLLMLSE